VASEPDAASTTASKYRKNFRWGEYVPPTQNLTLNARSAAAEVPISHLKISAAQRTLIETMYHPTGSTSFPTPPIVDHIFPLDSEAQLRASAIMAQHGLPLDVDSREHILYYFVQFLCHVSHPISENPCNNFFSILADFGDLSEKLKVTCR
jgi:hypothetical protein